MKPIIAVNLKFTFVAGKSQSHSINGVALVGTEFLHRINQLASNKWMCIFGSIELASFFKCAVT